MMLNRLALEPLRLLLAEFPAVAILGPRQVGKTTLAWALADQQGGATYLDLESPADAVRLSDPAAYFDAHRDELIVLDEVQRAPALFAELRGVIDQRRRAGKRHGQFLLLGSATGALLQQSAESLAGRIAYLELAPLCALEVRCQRRAAAVDSWWLPRIVSCGRRRRQPALAPAVHRHLPRTRHSATRPAHSCRNAAPLLDHAGP